MANRPMNMDKLNRKGYLRRFPIEWRVGLLVLVVCALVTPAAALAQVARVFRVEGTSMLERAGQTPRILGVGEQLEQQDVISVARDSNTILEFRDETRITLRPNTVFRLETFRDLSPESMFFGLVKGGFRAVTGLIGRRNPAAVRVQTTTATIGIRGTEFDARLCDDDCAAEERARPATRGGFNVIARIAEMSGVAAALQPGTPTRQLVSGAVLYESEAIATAADSYVVIAFRDGSRITLSGDTVLGIEQFRYQEQNPAQNSAAFRLSQGSARFLTGLIGQNNPDAYRINTAVGRLLTRGTQFDVLCAGACVEVASTVHNEVARFKAQADKLAAEARPETEQKTAVPQKSRPAPPPAGLVVHTLDGVVVMEAGTERLEVGKAATGVIASRDAKPTLMSAPPAYLTDLKAPRPDTVRVDPSMFAPAAPDYQAGLYVWVREGTVRLEKEAAARLGGTWGFIRTAATGPEILDVTAGNAAVATIERLTPLATVPNFMRFDATPLPERAAGGFVLPSFRAPDRSIVGLCTP